MDVVQTIMMIMVVTILATLTLAGSAYAAFRVRERRAPREVRAAVQAPVFFERVLFPAVEETREA